MTSPLAAKGWQSEIHCPWGHDESGCFLQRQQQLAHPSWPATWSHGVASSFLAGEYLPKPTSTGADPSISHIFPPF